MVGVEPRTFTMGLDVRCKEEREIQDDSKILGLGSGGDGTALYYDGKVLGWRQDVGINSSDLRMLNFRY